jgi:hypothetical protein
MASAAPVPARSPRRGGAGLCMVRFSGYFLPRALVDDLQIMKNAQQGLPGFGDRTTKQRLTSQGADQSRRAFHADAQSACRC